MPLVVRCKPSLLTLVAVAVFAVLGAACPPQKAAAPGPTSTAAPTSQAPALFRPAPPGKRVALLYTASVQGYVEPCGCTAEPLGGVARLAGAIDNAHAAYGDRVVLVDAGDLLFERTDDNAAADLCQAEGRIELLLSTLARKGLAATVRGPLDDVRGAAFRDAHLAAHNIASLDASLRSVVRDAGGVRVALIGARVDNSAELEREQQALRAEVARVQKQGVDVVVLVSRAPREVTKKLAAAAAGIDVVIQGKAPGEEPVAAERLGNDGPVLVASGQQAQHVGVVEIDVQARTAGAALALDDRGAQRDARVKLLQVRIEETEKQAAAVADDAQKQFLLGRVAQAKAERDALLAQVFAPLEGPHMVARSVALKRGMAEEARAKTELDAYRARIPALVAQCESALSCPAPPKDQPTYVGATTCKTCHAAAYDFWQSQRVTMPFTAEDGTHGTRSVGHAHAWDTLVDAKKQSDRQCVSCHSVGFGDAAGACRTSDIVPRGLQAVQCESCHGPGSAHAATARKDNIVGAPGEQTCRTCHRVPHIPTTQSFVFTDKLKLITGVGHGKSEHAQP